jgi:hypothetical protein
MLRLRPLTEKLSKHFPLHPSRQKTLGSMVFGALGSSNVHHQSLARYVESPNPKAALRKVERFFVRKSYLPGIMRKPLLTVWDLKASSICAWTGPTGRLGTRIPTILS